MLSCCCSAENLGVSLPKFQLPLLALFILTGLQGMGPNSGPGPEWPDKEQAVLRGNLESSSTLGSWPSPTVHLGETAPPFQTTGSQVGRGPGDLWRQNVRGKAVFTDRLPVITDYNMQETGAVLYLILSVEPLLPPSRWG